MRRALSALAVLLCVPRIGWADAGNPPLPLDLTWRAPAGCPNAGAVVRRVEQIVRGPRLDRQRVEAEAKIERRSEGRYELTLTLRTLGTSETKTVAATSCASLAEATAVVVALAIDPSSSADEAGPGGGAGEETDDRARPAAAATSVPARHPSPPSRESSREDEARRSEPESPPALRFAPGVHGAMTAGILPEIAIGFGISATLRIRRFRAGLLGTWSLRQSPSFSRVAGASFDIIEGGAYGAYLLPLGGMVALGPSVNLEVTYVRARSFGIREPRTTSTAWPALVLGGRVEARISRRFGLFGRPDLVLPIGAPQFFLATSGSDVELHQPSAAALRLTLGAEIVLP